MQYAGPSSTQQLWLLLGMAIFLIATIVSKKFSLGRLFDRRTPGLVDTEGSAIISFFTLGHSLFNAKRGKVNGMRYSFLLTGPQPTGETLDMGYVKDGALIYTLDLPFNTETHLIGLSKDFKVDRLQFENFLKANNMQKITLEGDFPDYFDLFAKPGQGFEARYVLDPEAMNFIVDYCRTHFWEINRSELYFVLTSEVSGPLDIVEEAQQFVDHIKPALKPGTPGAPVVHHEAPYGEYDGSALPCPICNKTMTLTDNWQVCRDQHGVFLDGKDLERLHNHDLSIDLPASAGKNHGPLTCPNCHHPMTLVDYEGSTALQIDTCEHCPFRWLDAPEVAKITRSKV